jgi:hypothetical protein
MQLPEPLFLFPFQIFLVDLSGQFTVTEQVVRMKDLDQIPVSLP